MKKIFFILIFCFISLIVFAQDNGVAVEESPFSAGVNPALIGTGNSSGIGWLNNIENGELGDNYSLYLSGRRLAYFYDNREGEASHNLALGFPVSTGLFMGTSLVFPEEKSRSIEWNLSLLARPLNFISLALRTMDVAAEKPYLIYGAGVRPFFFSRNWISRFTLFSDFKYEDEHEAASWGIRLEPLDGFSIYTDYYFEKSILESGLSLSLNHFTAGLKGETDTDYYPETGKMFASIPVRRQRSVIATSPSIIVEYDMGNIIRDYPGGNNIISSLIAGGKGGTNSIYNFLRDMENIANTPEIKAVIFKNQMFLTSYANISEISESLYRLKKAGKKIYFYFDNAGNSSYTLAASAADEIYLNPMGSINLRGFGKHSVYMKDFFEKFGVEFYNFRSHDYKTAYNSFTESGMTEEEKEALEKLYRVFQDKQIEFLEKGRGGKLKRSAEETVGDGPYFSSSQAEEAGLVDRIIYEDELDGIYRSKNLMHVNYSLIPEKYRYRWESMAENTIAVIYASGDIVPGQGLKGSMIGSDSFISDLRQACSNPSVRAVVVRIDSGGGSAFSSDIIAREIARCREGDNPTPVIVSMGGMAASGGYYMAAPAEIIFADEVTVTGSIGVIALFPDISGLLAKLGLKYDGFSFSENSDFGNPLRPMTEEETAKIREYISDNYDRFLGIVSRYRDIPEEEADKAARGRVWSGRDAVELGLADRIGGLDDAIGYAAEKYAGDSDCRIIEIVTGKELFSIPFFLNKAEADDINRTELLSGDIEKIIDFYKRIDRFERGEALFLLPYSAEEIGVTE